MKRQFMQYGEETDKTEPSGSVLFSYLNLQSVNLNVNAVLYFIAFLMAAMSWS